MHKPWRKLGVVAALGALLVGTAVFAQGSSSKNPGQSTGVLDYIEPTARILHVTVDDKDFPVLFDGATTFRIDDATADITRLQRGDKLQIDWTPRDGKKVATAVQVVERQPGRPVS